jgi:RNA polymerase sigma-70 factor, ECF subfamily
MAHEPNAATETAEDVLHARRLAQCLQQRMDALPELQRTAYRLLQQEGLSLKKAAEVLGTSVTAVKLRAHRAYVALRAAVREAGGAS